ncbi:3-dehydroquinate synthase [Anthocerotibacter panamensis]|uniref:3-dehydroquinate synthase n=1 Tax=Anthocerotibacter panamensis TaxID=2857077 RepID=UPI001C403DBE|nr:3-dehydroquinate synthase [Anthocerotibacter panamensis]
MPTISVPLPTHPYTLHLAALNQLGALVQSQVRGRKLLLVSQPAIFNAWGERVLTSLGEAGYGVGVCLIPAGERFKNFRTLQRIFAECQNHGLDRGCGLVALGGGVVGDITGFAAATWLRGIPVVQVPTSLLAMVDAAIGGKTGVNTPQGKNLIGAFHQPALVLMDPEVLTTLPAREWRSGLAEVIKYGVIWDSQLFELLEQQPTLAAKKLPPDTLLSLLTHAAQAKAQVVTKDEREGGLRAILNYGHTLGHAIETATHYRKYTHGEAVGLGMLGAGRLAVRLGLWSTEACARQDTLIARAGLPMQFPALDPGLLLSLMQGDKKVEAGRVRFVLPTRIGQAELVDNLPREKVLQVVQELVGTA